MLKQVTDGQDDIHFRTQIITLGKKLAGLDFGLDDEHPSYSEDRYHGILRVYGDGELLIPEIKIWTAEDPVMEGVKIAGICKLLFVIDSYDANGNNGRGKYGSDGG